MSSMDSTETFASCTTHPFPSQADLTADPNLYVNPLDDHHRMPNTYTKTTPQGRAPLASSESICGSPVKKRVPRAQAYIAELYDDSKSTDRLLISSCSSLQESPIPKHRRTRFTEVRA